MTVHKSRSAPASAARTVAWYLALLVILLSPFATGPGGVASAAPDCTYRLGFARLHDLIVQSEGEDLVGDCLEDQYHAPNGDAIQQTRAGLFVWRQASNWTGFTDGRYTWVSSSAGVDKRSTAERSPGESSAPDAIVFLSSAVVDLPQPIEVDEATRQIQVLHNATEGATFNLYFGDLAGKQLYAVGIYPDRSMVVPGPQVPTGVLRRFILDNRDLLRDPRVSVGTWFSTDRNLSYLDISATLPDREQAIELGRRYNQISIFDLDSFEEIDTGGSGENIPSLPAVESRLPERAGVSR